MEKFIDIIIEALWIVLAQRKYVIRCLKKRNLLLQKTSVNRQQFSRYQNSHFEENLISKEL